eukprot:1029229-Pelagomonas_calceolata.AAC.1
MHNFYHPCRLSLVLKCGSPSAKAIKAPMWKGGCLYKRQGQEWPLLASQDHRWSRSYPCTQFKHQRKLADGACIARNPFLSPWVPSGDQQICQCSRRTARMCRS